MTEKEKQKVIPITIEGFEINAQNVNFQKLHEFSLILYEKLLNQRKERSFLTLERDKLKIVLDNIRHENNVSRAISTNKDNEMDQAQERYHKEIKEMEQEVKFIQYDHNINLSELKKWGTNLIEKNEVKHFEEELDLLQEKRQLKISIADVNLKSEKDLQEMKNQSTEELENLKDKHEEMRIKKELEYEINLNSTVEHLTLKFEMEMFELEERKNTHLANLKRINKNRIDEMKRFFNSITAEHLAVISDLKQNLDNLEKKKDLTTAEVKLLKVDNKEIQKMLHKIKLQVSTLGRQFKNYQKDLESLKNKKSQLNRTEMETVNIKLHSDSTLKKIKEEDNLDCLKILDSNLFNVMKNLKNTAMKKRHHLEELISVLIREVRNKQKLIKHYTTEPVIKQALTELKFEYWNPRKLSYELAVMCKAHDDLLKTLQEKLEEMCLPEKNLGKMLLDVENIGKTSSSFISKQ